jgi:hypothetical protein
LLAALLAVMMLAAAVRLWGHTIERSSVMDTAQASPATEGVDEAAMLEPPVAPEVDVPVGHGITITR